MVRWVCIAALALSGCDWLPDAPIVAESEGDSEDVGDEADTGEPDPDPDPSADTIDPDPSDSDDDPDPSDTDDDPPGPLIDHCTLEGPPALSIVHGSGSYDELADATASLVYGFQGGTHIDIALRAEHLDVSGTFISDIRGYLDGVQVAAGSGGGGFLCDAGTLYLIRDGIELRFDLAPDEIDGQTFDVEAELTDSAGTIVTAFGTVSVSDPN